jgi:uncharacterized membrane protein SpoIIM required for sporulation
MIKKLQNLEKQTKYNILVITFALSLFMAITINAFISMIYVSTTIQNVEHEFMSLSLNGGYYEVNGHKMGVPIFVNAIGVLFLWILMIVHTLKEIKRPNTSFS